MLTSGGGRVTRALHEDRVGVGLSVGVVAVQPKGGAKRPFTGRGGRAQRGGSVGVRQARNRTGTGTQAERETSGHGMVGIAGGDERKRAALTLRGLRELLSDRVSRAIMRRVHLEDAEVELAGERIHHSRLAAAERPTQDTAAVLFAEI